MEVLIISKPDSKVPFRGWDEDVEEVLDPIFKAFDTLYNPDEELLPFITHIKMPNAMSRLKVFYKYLHDNKLYKSAGYIAYFMLWKLKYMVSDKRLGRKEAIDLFVNATDIELTDDEKDKLIQKIGI